MSRLCLILAALISAAPCYAQIQIDAGAGTLFGNAGGIGITSYSETGQLFFGATYTHHRIIPGVLDSFQYRNTSFGFGSQTIGYQIQGSGVATACVCIAAKQESKKLTAQAFIGATGTGFFFFGNEALPQHIGAGLLLNYKVRSHFSVSSLSLISGRQITEAVGTSYKTRHLDISGSSGVLNNQKYFLGNVTANRDGFSIYAARQNYFEPFVATGNNAGVSFHRSILNVSAGANESESRDIHATGFNTGAGINWWKLSAQSFFYRSDSPISRQTILSHTITARMSPRLSLTGSINQSNRNSFSGGASYSGRRFSISFERQISFLLTGQGYANTTAVSFSIRIHDTQISASTVTDPLGKSRWLAQQQTFVQRTLPGVAASGTRSASHAGKFLIEGIVVDTRGVPVAGAALRIGDVTVFSDSSGKFSAHFKKRGAYSVAVLTDEFVSGEWSVTAAPGSASTGDDLRIVVALKG